MEPVLPELSGADAGVDAAEGQEGDEWLLAGAKTALDPTPGLRGWGDEMGAAQGGEGELEFGAGIPAVGLEGQGRPWPRKMRRKCSE